MEEEITREEKSADEKGKHGDDVVLCIKDMEAKLDSMSKHCQPAHPFTIGQVRRDIRMVDTHAYEPLFVSIGPYHRRNESLADMEEVKWRNLKDFRGRAGESFNKYLKTMKEIAPRTRACYSGNIDMEADEFIEMMLLDSLFIIELLRTQGKSFLALQGFFNIDEEEPFYSGTLSGIAHDVFLLENQLPFFVLERLWNLTDQGSRFDLWKSACTFILDSALPFEHEWDRNLLKVIFNKEEEKKKSRGENPEMVNEDGVHHLLHLVHLLLEPTSSTGKSESSAKPPAFIKKILSFLSPCMSKDKQRPRLTVIPSAAELEEAGVEFQWVGANSFLDIEFGHGTMKMPHLLVQDFTKSVLRNLIAFEQNFPNPSSHITCYCSFMDDLVNTPRDVEILKKSGIIENYLGCDKEVADLFNDLCKGVFLPVDSKNYLAKPSEDVRSYTKKEWPKWRAKLLHDYFGSPWSIISFLGVTIVIILTIVQTYDAVFT